jgi:ArsR family transcriptional regulator
MFYVGHKGGAMSATQWRAVARGDAPYSHLDHPLSLSQATSLANMFKALSEPVRLLLLSLIASHADGDVCGCDMVTACRVSQPIVSHHLRILRDAGLITARRQGQRIQYQIVPEAMACLAEVLQAASRGQAPIPHP